MRVGAQIEIAAAPDAVWRHISDPARYLEFMAGVTRWEVVSTEHPIGLGSRYRTLLRVGSADVGGLIEVVEFDECRDLAWASITGIDQRGRWRLRARDAGARTSVELRLAYGVAGAGISGWIAEQFAAPTVRGHLRGSLARLKRQLEHEQLRERAAARREARAGAV